MENQEKIYQNFTSRIPMLNHYAFNLAYREMCENPEVSVIHLDACAMEIGEGGTPNVSYWVTAPLVPFVKQDRDIWTATVSITPSAVKYLTTNNGVEFECRIQGHVTALNIPFTSILSLKGKDAKGNVIDVQDFHCLVQTTETTVAPETKPKRPALQVVK